MKKLAFVLLLILALIPVYMGGAAVVAEVQAYRALKAEHVAVLKFLGEPIATQKDADGKDVPVTRAMLLDVAVRQVLDAAKAESQ
jgi:hypothetical protein